MLSEDYIIRMIQLAVAALLKIAGLRKEGRYDDALTAVDLALEQLVGLRASRVKNLDDERLYFLLTRDGLLDTRRLALVSQLFEAEGDVYAQQNRPVEAQAAYPRALRYALEVFFQEGEPQVDQAEQDFIEGEGGIQEQIAGLLQKLDLERLEPDGLWPLAGYFEETGQYARAEAILTGLAERPDLRAGLAPEIAAFYERLLAKADTELAAGGVQPEKIRESLAHWRDQGISGG
jgi:hypothetical protein